MAHRLQERKNLSMSHAAKLSATVAALILGSTALAGCTATTAPQAATPTLTPTVSAPPTPIYVTELPGWARDSRPWLIYPEGFECWGTEGCPNDFRALIGEPGPVLPEGVEYYDPAKHDCIVVQPADVSCSE